MSRPVRALALLLLGITCCRGSVSCRPGAGVEANVEPATAKTTKLGTAASAPASAGKGPTPTAFDDYRACFAGTLPIKARVVEIGKLEVESKRVNVADCFGGGGWDGKPLAETIPNGTYRVELCVLVGENGHADTHAFARMVVSEGDEKASKTIDKFGVDAGTACFFTPEGHARIDPELEKLPKKKHLKHGKLVPRGASHGVVFFWTGGDGVFEVWKTQSADGDLRSLVIDFGELGGEDE